MVDPTVRERIANFTIENPGVDLSVMRASSHARYWYNLHIVFVNEGRWRQIDTDVLTAMHQMIAQAAAAKSHQLSRGAILSDHIHLAIGCDHSESPIRVGLGYMNNLAFACRMKAVFSPSLYMGTFGEYDLSTPSFWRKSVESSPHGDKPRGGGVKDDGAC